MRQRTKNSELDAAKAILNGLHNESVSYSHRLDILTMNISSQMKKRLEVRIGFIVFDHNWVRN